MSPRHGPWCGGRSYPTTCRDCGTPISVYQCGHGSVVLFQHLGSPWPRHSCLEVDSTPMDVGSAAIPRPTRWRRVASQDWESFAVGVQSILDRLAFDTALIVETEVAGAGCLIGYTPRGLVVALPTNMAGEHHLTLARMGFIVSTTLPSPGSWRLRRFDFMEGERASGMFGDVLKELSGASVPSGLRAGEQVWWLA